MIHAIMEGRKTQTRRIIKQQPKYASHDKVLYKGRELTINSLDNNCNYGQQGEILWVREGFLLSPDGCEILYLADLSSEEIKEYKSQGWKNKPSIHMPSYKTRMHLQIIKTRAERLNEITQEDAKAEGVAYNTKAQAWRSYYSESSFMPSALDSFRTLWKSIHGQDSWMDNPWVWVIEFRRIK